MKILIFIPFFLTLSRADPVKYSETSNDLEHDKVTIFYADKEWVDNVVYLIDNGMTLLGQLKTSVTDLFHSKTTCEPLCGKLLREGVKNSPKIPTYAFFLMIHF